MRAADSTAGRDERIARLVVVGVQRAAGLFLFACGLVYWTRLVGVFPGAAWRFDLMPAEWRVAAPALAVLCPVAGVGLWMTASWGAVVWIIVAAVETVMHLPFADVFGPPGPDLALDVAGLALLGLARLVLWHARRARRPPRSG